MKKSLILIRHAMVDFDWEKSYTSKTFDLACAEYNIRPIRHNKQSDIDVKKIDNDGKVFISDLPRTRETAKLVFPGQTYIEDEIFTEVPNRSFIDTELLIAKRIWATFGRIQWFFNSKRQYENLKETLVRADRGIEKLEKTITPDTVLVCHEVLLRVMVHKLRGRGYLPQARIRYDNLSCIHMKEG